MEPAGEDAEPSDLRETPMLEHGHYFLEMAGLPPEWGIVAVISFVSWPHAARQCLANHAPRRPHMLKNAFTFRLGA